jgi:hypothetical protein
LYIQAEFDLPCALESAWFQTLYLECDLLVSKFASATEFNVYRYAEGRRASAKEKAKGSSAILKVGVCKLN